MKQILSLLLILLLFCFARCRKDRADSNGLPPATQQGKNTLGFLLNGQPWTPKGFSGTANLSIDVDFGYKNGVLGIVAYRTLSSTDKTQFILGVLDSLNFISAPATLTVRKNSLGALSFSNKNYCDINHYDATIFTEGKITIAKLDKANRIVSGSFYGTLYKQECGDTLKITEGRFDMKY